MAGASAGIWEIVSESAAVRSDFAGKTAAGDSGNLRKAGKSAECSKQDALFSQYSELVPKAGRGGDSAAVSF